MPSKKNGYLKKVRGNDVEKTYWVSATPHVAGGFEKLEDGHRDFIDIRDLPKIARSKGLSSISLAGDWKAFGETGFGQKVSVSEFEKLLKKVFEES